MYLLYVFFAAIGIFFSVYYKSKIDSRRLNTRQKRLKSINPEIKYEYNRFNVKKERSFEFKFKDDRIKIRADIQRIQIAEQQLISKISSEYDQLPLTFDIIVFPFEKALFEIDGYKNFNQDGVLIIGSYENQTKRGLENIKELKFIADLVPEKTKAIYIQLKSFKTDKTENKVLLFGVFPDGNEFNLAIDYKDYVLEIDAPIHSIKKTTNFQEYTPL